MRTDPELERGPAGPERLQRILARAGFGSRRSTEDLIREGRVRLDGRVAELGDRADASRALITVDGSPVPTDPGLCYFAFHKPAGVTTTLKDRHAARPLTEFLPPGPRVFPVGRLDRESEGLLILTNDGRLAHRVQHPRYGVEKEYLAEIQGRATPQAVRRLVAGIPLPDGAARAVRATLVPSSGSRSAVRVVMVEGRKREVRRMLAVVGLVVVRLVRTRIGPITLEGIPPGKLRALAPREVVALYAAATAAAPATAPAVGRPAKRVGPSTVKRERRRG